MFKLSASFNAKIYKYINKYHHGHRLNQGDVIIRDMSNIRSVPPFINVNIGNFPLKALFVFEKSCLIA